MKRIVISTESSISPQSADFGALLGTEHYSYNFVASRFERALSSAGFTVSFISTPESYKHGISFRAEFKTGPDSLVHISFRSTKNIRPLIGATNIVHFAWEFPFLKSETAPYEPITCNQVHMLGLMDYIWVPSRYAFDVLTNYGLRNVSLIPEPICRDAAPNPIDYDRAWHLLKALPVAPFVLSSEFSRDDNIEFVQSGLSSFGDLPVVSSKKENNGSKIFLTICNPSDLRKNFLNIIEGFQLAVQDRFDSLLLVKMVIPNKQDFRNASLYDHVLPLLHGPGGYNDHRIQLITDFLAEEEMSALYAAADYYICASHCEGFNLPLLEAMSFGVLPITTANTAMADYIDDSVAVVIGERTFPSPVRGMAGDIAGRVYPLSYASRFDIAKAIQEAVSLAADEREKKAEAARRRVAERYSEERVVELMLQSAPHLFGPGADEAIKG